jgi:prepilin-type N-terminal cleavage/methylation domain-containing protein
MAKRFYLLWRRGRRGFSLIESMMAMVILSIVGIGAGVGLQSMAGSSSAIEDRVWTAQQMSAKLENLRDLAYASQLSGSSTSDADRSGSTYLISWIVVEIDPAAPTASPPTAKTNSGLKQITLTMNGQSLVTWVSQ